MVLVGLPGSGKTTVGRLVATTLGAEFVDLDEAIEREQGMAASRIFAERGETAFRALERDAARQVIARAPAVIAPGGGWAAQPGNLEQARGSSLLVYLRTEPEEAARRAAPASGRPLLQGDDPARVMQRLLAEREVFYHRADAIVGTDGCAAEEVARQVVTLARSRAGW